ncbi:hypothetical protein [Kibdelosporangium phytohabitans]|uniref:hypothetical protein n=1 Tax=Kibdelosporangium phytohabitans TaxID=860235 RepID=UPI0007C76E0B|nr:hypothetical protein [Kibdelosporangium phytohabitans]MBE1469676.1 hypothetical protein [Kibdelosporangium phytohabitans]
MKVFVGMGKSAADSFAAYEKYRRTNRRGIGGFRRAPCRDVDMLAGVKQVVRVRVLPTREQESALLATLNACDAAASSLSKQMHAASVFRKFDVRKRFYAESRERFGLAAQPTGRVVGKTVDA